MTDHKSTSGNTANAVPAPQTDPAPLVEPVSLPQRELSPEAQRALAEAVARRAEARTRSTSQEYGGRSGPDPIRYGDWEKGGIASDF